MTRPATKEEEEVDVLQSWMEVGGLPACPEKEAKGFLAEVNPFLHFFFMLPSSFHLSSATEPSPQSLHLIVIGYFLVLFRG